MQIQLSPDVEALVTRIVARGAYATPEELVNAILLLNLDPPELLRRHDELKALIREGVESAERGELYDGDEVFDEVLRDLEAAVVRSE